ncbi:MAG: type II toxin-antitoxin system PemK/MazF family toxin [Minisyncoccia bacterium]
MQKDFDKWNTEKKNVDAKTVNTELFFYAREIWWCSVGLNVGVEADGKHENFERPMLIIKKFNADMIWALPLTTQGQKDKYHHKLNHEEIKSFVVLSQIKTISTKRLLRKIGSISETDFKDVIMKIQNFLKIESSLAGAFSEAEATNKKIIDESQNNVKRQK